MQNIEQGELESSQDWLHGIQFLTICENEYVTIGCTFFLEKNQFAIWWITLIDIKNVMTHCVGWWEIIKISY